MSKFQIDDYVRINPDVATEWYYAGHTQAGAGYIEHIRTEDVSMGNLYQKIEITFYTMSSHYGERWEAAENDLHLAIHPAAHLQERLDL